MVMLTSSCSGFANTFEVKGNGKTARGAFDISLNYNSISVDRGIRVELIESSKGEGFITADEKVLGHVSIVEENGQVRVSYRPHNIVVRTKIETVVTIPISNNLSYLEASSAGSIKSDHHLVCENLTLDGSSAAHFDLDVEASKLNVELDSAAGARIAAKANRIDVETDSASKCQMSGTTNYLDIETDSAAKFAGFELISREAVVDASSAGGVEINVTKELTVDVSSGASVRYKGSPSRIHQDVSSGGSLRSVD